jgi:hypothetical protein
VKCVVCGQVAKYRPFGRETCSTACTEKKRLARLRADKEHATCTWCRQPLPDDLLLRGRSRCEKCRWLKPPWTKEIKAQRSEAMKVRWKKKADAVIAAKESRWHEVMGPLCAMPGQAVFFEDAR